MTLTRQRNCFTTTKYSTDKHTPKAQDENTRKPTTHLGDAEAPPVFERAANNWGCAGGRSACKTHGVGEFHAADFKLASNAVSEGECAIEDTNNQRPWVYV